MHEWEKEEKEMKHNFTELERRYSDSGAHIIIPYPFLFYLIISS